MIRVSSQLGNGTTKTSGYNEKQLKAPNCVITVGIKAFHKIKKAAQKTREEPNKTQSAVSTLLLPAKTGSNIR